MMTLADDARGKPVGKEADRIRDMGQNVRNGKDVRDAGAKGAKDANGMKDVKEWRL